VLDFLFQALAEWEKAKTKALTSGAKDVPDHRLSIRAVTGTSAGGICSALAAMMPFTGHYPVEAPNSAATAKNLLYKCWVKDIDLTKLLARDDLGGEAVPSLLNGNAVAAVATDAVTTVRAAIAGGASPQAPAWFANPLELYLCVTNLTGTPYLIQMIAADPIRGHRVTTHADYAHFAVVGAGAGATEPLPLAATPVNWPGTQGQNAVDGWDRLLEAALATSAFPVGLPARPFENERLVYEARRWPRPYGEDADKIVTSISPLLDPPQVKPTHDFWTLDGGLINNEPLELARTALSGAPDAHNPRDPRQANRAVLMIDPFPEDEEQPDRAKKGDSEPPDMFESLFGLLPLLKTQARFKPEEVMLAMHEGVHSRFLIAPTRRKYEEGETNIASFGVSGFAGFVHEKLRQHDFFLGRRNCQQFLRNHLVVHVENPIVKPWVDRLKAAGALEQFHPLITLPGGTRVEDEDFVQLVPLYGAAAKRIDAPTWPKLDREREVHKRLEKGIEKRTSEVMDVALNRLLKRVGIDTKIGRGIIKAVIRRPVTKAVANKALGTIVNDLETRKLLK